MSVRNSPRRADESAVAAERDRSAISELERRRPRIRGTLGLVAGIVFVVLAIACAGPILWLAKASVSTSQDTLREPFALWPSGIQLQNLVEAFTRLDIGIYILNTVWVAGGVWLISMIVAVSGAYGIVILRPRYARWVSSAVLATLFLPGVVTLVAQYVVILDVPLVGINLIDTYWAVWLPAAANAFNVLLLSQFFRSLPGEIFEAARIDGAGKFTILWRIVLPMSRPVLGVASVLTIIAAWKEFLWPLLVLPGADKQPLSVALYRIAVDSPLDLLLAAMFISVIVPIVIFLIFQRQFLQSAGQAGALKG